jgi:hypothetical protein
LVVPNQIKGLAVSRQTSKRFKEQSKSWWRPSKPPRGWRNSQKLGGSAFCYKAAKSKATLNAPFIEALTRSPLNNKLEADIKFIRALQTFC